MAEIIPMQQEHVEQVCDIGKECFSIPWSLDGVKAELNNPHSVTLVAMEDHSVVGFVNAHCIYGEGYINNIAVTKSYRRHGIGFLLVQALTDYGEQNKIDFFTLEVRRSNENAIMFYEKHGFQKVGERKRFYEKPVEDAMLYTRSLNNN
ncbi:ribosomal protein S18-alanine N-acetyltransferase [Paludicola sp. MB14-C6]|uniref:ribosomal protein S18-alanine N-acetyltransferase n=1 Tax=Paludihabitans sp. MB14-C6 TaxID=3070656 RepID=UPI0027DC3228|nr:ribosomal protein S18-alanine N-acetyltransferase [Paludicola sp. MB14-C6]WMJ22365.1 ribosomal protein S18-alanine N-acetyltransferase [Paludicola sp. MB14-C6]